MDEESPQQRQDNEFEVLQSIFGTDLVDNREPIAWKLWRPLDLLLTLHPLHSYTTDGVHCSVTLHILCCPNYPNKAPVITINKMHGLSNENAAKMLEELDKMSLKLCGEVMIFELAQHVQNFLHAYNKPTLSFYDQMLERQNELERLKQHDLKVKEDIERQKIKDEIQRQQELKSEGRQRQRHRSVSQDAAGGEDSSELVYYEDNKEVQAKMENSKDNVNVPCNCPLKTMSSLRISQRNNRKIHIGNCLGHSHYGSVTNAAMDSDSGDLLICKKWQLNPTSDLQSRNRHVHGIENDFKATYRIKHAVLTPYHGMEFVSETRDNRTVQCVYLFRDYVRGCSLSFLRTSVQDDFEALKLVRFVASGVFSGLSELHSVGVVHGDVRGENVFLDIDGGVRLVGASLDVRLREIVRGGSYGYRQTKAHDIYCTAQLLLSLISKRTTGQEIPSHLPSVVKDFFSRCLIEDSSFQWTPDQLLNHGFLRDTPTQVSGAKEKDDGYSGSEDESRKLAKKFVENCLPASGHSRLSDEFEIIKVLGKGAFGEVIKVRNKLDGGFYAIKHIELNPENVQLNKKITREVKLLSRLNHENVVRYYNAWIETIRGPLTDESSEKTDSDLNKDKVAQVKTPQRSPEKKCRVLNSIENIAAKLAPGVKLEWSISGTPVQRGDSVSDSSESEDDDDDCWMNPTTTEDMSSSIEFEVNTNDESLTFPSEPLELPRPPTVHIHQALYIQMEFCEKNTLRQAIDNSLYLEHVRAWRLFREIVEGLAHVHQRGMIHRDLKPVNIFLDSNDHVKIGDFGLATTAFTGLPRPTEDKTKTHEDFGGSLTGQVGTALYVAPELLQAANKVIYNQKVDIYSLGIILFEMFHPPLDTGMERIQVLKELRLKDVKLPNTFNCEQNLKQINVIRWLLNHDPSKRPTCAELLGGPHIPRPMAEGALLGLISHTLNSKGTKGYQRLIDACMDQQWSQTEDYMYSSSVMKPQDPMLAVIRDCIVKVFVRHGACELAPPLLQPRAASWELRARAVPLMTAHGAVVHLPHDLRLPFARFTAYSDMKYIRRYIIDKVFREKSTNSHPREILECAFDIVTPKTAMLWTDAELLLVANSVATELGLQVSFQINHTAILRIVLLSCGISADKHVDLYPVLVDVGTGRINKIQLQTHLTSLCLTPRDTAKLLRLLESDVPVHEAKSLITPVIKRNELNDQFSRAVTELETVTRNAKALGVDNPITFMPCLAYNATQQGGIFWQMTCSKDQKKYQSRHRSSDLIAVGGRYDTLVNEFWQVAKSGKDEQELKTTSVGFSMAPERIAAILKKREVDVSTLSTSTFESGARRAVCVCVWGAAGSGRRQTAATRRAGVTRALVEARVPVLTAQCRGVAEARDLTAADLVLLLEDDDAVLTAACWEGDNMREYRVAYTEVVDFVKDKLQVEPAQISEVATCVRSTSCGDNDKMNNSLLSVVIIAEGKLSSVARRRYESQACSAVCGALSRAGAAGAARRACALALWCSAECLRALAAHLVEECTNTDRLLHRFPQYRDILTETMGELSKMSSSKSSDEANVLALYSLPDGVCKLIL